MKKNRKPNVLNYLQVFLRFQYVAKLLLICLGNDAAHIELKHFDTIGQEEVRIGILFTKELLKAVYQSSQIADLLESLKRPTV